MTPVFCCGFECGFNTHWTNISVLAADTTTKRTGDRSLRSNTTSAGSNGVVTLAVTTIKVVRFYVRFTVLPNVDTRIFVFEGESPFSARGGVYFISSDNKLYAHVGAVLSSTGISVTTGQWYRIDFKLNVSGNPWLADLQVDGTATTQASDAVAASTLERARIGLRDPATADFYYDDIVLSDTSGDYPIGAGYINHFVPTADGTHNVAGANDFERSSTGIDITNATTDAYQLIDDVPLKSGTPTEFINLIAPPNATDYVEVVFGPAPGISTPTVAPRGVDAIVAVAAAQTTINNLRIALNDNGTIDDIRNATVGSTTCVYSRKHYANPPSAATAWTVVSGDGNFNNVRMRCYTSDANPDPYWASAMIEAEFQEIEPTPNKTVIINQSVNRAATY